MPSLVSHECAPHPTQPTSTDWRGVPAIRKEMNKAIIDPSLFGCCEESLQVSDVAVYPSITDKTKEVKTTILTLDLVKGCQQLRLSEK